MRVPDLFLRLATAFARRQTETRPPDFTVGGKKRPYLHRWHLIKDREIGGVYWHRFLRDDDDRAVHDHPWASLSILMQGKLEEVWCPAGDPADPANHRRRVLLPGSVVYRSGTFSHRVILHTPTVETLFMVGPKYREWGFHCAQGWRRWQEFAASGCSD